VKQRSRPARSQLGIRATTLVSVAVICAVAIGPSASATISSGIYKGRLRIVKTVGQCGHQRYVWNKFSVRQTSRRVLRIREVAVHYRMKLVKHGRWYRGHRYGRTDRWIWMRPLSGRDAFKFVGINSGSGCSELKKVGVLRLAT
jgi:hypothetical protein